MFNLIISICSQEPQQYSLLFLGVMYLLKYIISDVITF